MHAVKNYGSALQTYATQKILTDKGFEVEIINYIRKKNLDSNLAKTWTKEDSGIKRVIKKLILYPTIIRWINVFNNYLKKYINTSSRIYTSEEELVTDPVKADVFCTGGDQVWNSGWNEGIEKPFYLTFVPDNTPKISISSSIGKSELTSEECERVFPYLRRYKYLTIRETSSVEFLKNNGFDNVDFCIDPTQLLTREQWLEHAIPYKKKLGKYILIYQLNHDEAFDRYAEEVARKKGLPLYRICTRYDQVRLSGKSIFIPKVQEWLSLINNAELVITNSFHATAFCINLNTPFISINSNEYSCRIGDVLKLYNLEDRRINDYSQFDIVDRPINFDRVNGILSRERERCIESICKMISDCVLD